MSTPTSQNESSILRRFASLIGLLGAALFFMGWIYRSVYFFQFSLELTTLELPVQSFFIVPIQVILGDTRAIIRAIVALGLMINGIYVTLWGIKKLGKLNKVVKVRLPYPRKSKRRWVRFLCRQMHSLITFNPLDFDSIKFLRSLVDETVIVAWVLLILFHLAQSQAIADVKRDIGPNSTLPVVTLITPEDRLPLGRLLEDEFIDPSVQGFRFFGDHEAFENILAKENTDIRGRQPRVWRLLLERDGWIYLIDTSLEEPQTRKVPPVVAIQKSIHGDQLMILNPTFHGDQ
ncbi:MAG: hypothetical protein J7525_22000 [Roseofilum sp. SID3]|uniref:hypothetical protein n=1 Tax=unclassified Roseofilum TaxID=2620099 RepID=UPI001B0406B3|nr:MULTISPECIES: hypothetical protein [unclassified Roseofilum]MBP0015768.1 hypothetical protein [Roseofilum sp. SID3]MBP0036561.1 hypothetical protein [Roseofilum sp. SID1]